MFDRFLLVGQACSFHSACLNRNAILSQCFVTMWWNLSLALRSFTTTVDVFLKYVLILLRLTRWHREPKQLEDQSLTRTFQLFFTSSLCFVHPDTPEDDFYYPCWTGWWPTGCSVSRVLIKQRTRPANSRWNVALPADQSVWTWFSGWCWTSMVALSLLMLLTL